MSNATDIPLAYTREELLERLQILRAKAEKVDARNLAKHQKAEAAFLKRFQAACKKAATWDYETAKEASWDPRSLIKASPGDRRRYGSPSAPSCPRSEVTEIDRYISMVERTTQPRFTMSKNGKWWALYDLLTRDVPRSKGLC